MTNLERIIIMQVIGRKFVMKIHQELFNNGRAKMNYPIKKWPSHINRHFCGRTNSVASKHMKSHSNSLEVREMQIKVTMRLFITFTWLLETAVPATGSEIQRKRYLHTLPRDIWIISVGL